MGSDLERFTELGRESGYDLDFSLASLDGLESFALERLDRGEEDNSFKNRAARYLGETFRRNVGGKWEIAVDGPEYMNFKLPVLKGYSDLDIDFCPLEVFENFAVRRTPGLLQEAVRSHLEFKRP
jgi:hypothetical protein